MLCFRVISIKRVRDVVDSIAKAGMQGLIKSSRRETTSRMKFIQQ